MDARMGLLAACVFVAFATEAAVGFGSLVVSLALGAQIYPLEELLPRLVPLSCVLAGAIALRNAERVDRSLLRRRVLPIMAPGVVVGAVIAGAVDGALLRAGFGALLIVLAARELARPAPSPEDAPLAPAIRAPAAPWIALAGVLHGIFASGGPPLVYALGRLGLEKARFRATLAVVWLVSNAGLTALLAARGRIGAPETRTWAALLPVVALALWAGDRLHVRLCDGPHGERRFRAAVFALLLVAGAAVLARALTHSASADGLPAGRPSQSPAVSVSCGHGAGRA